MQVQIIRSHRGHRGKAGPLPLLPAHDFPQITLTSDLATSPSVLLQSINTLLRSHFSAAYASSTQGPSYRTPIMPDVVISQLKACADQVKG